MLLLLASLGLFARLTSNREFNELKQARHRATVSCQGLQQDPVTKSELESAARAFDDDKRVEVILAVRQAEAAYDTEDATKLISSLRATCSRAYLVGIAGTSTSTP